MRIILSDELFLDEGYISLTKQETDRLFKIVALFAKEDKKELSLAYICGFFDISEEFKSKTSFCINYAEKVTIKQYFNWFKGNKSAVKKSRERAKQKHNELSEETIEAIKEVENGDAIKISNNIDKQKQDNINYKRIIDSFNENFKNTKVPGIKVLNDKRRNMLKKLYKDMKVTLAEEVDIYEFYEAYFNMISDNKNLVEGWAYAKGKDGWFQPDIDYFLKDKCFIKLVEGK